LLDVQRLLVTLKQHVPGFIVNFYFNKQIQIVFRNEVMGIPWLTW